MTDSPSVVAALTIDLGGIVAAVLVFCITGAIAYGLGSRRATLAVRSQLATQVGDLSESVRKFIATVEALQESVNRQGVAMAQTAADIRQDLKSGADEMTQLGREIGDNRTAMADCKRECARSYASNDQIQTQHRESREKFSILFEQLRVLVDRISKIEGCLQGIQRPLG